MKHSKTPDTVRGRKSSTLSSVQRFLPLAEIRNNTVLLKNGGIRAILEVEALNFNLKSETEQKGIIAGYAAFVNTLTFPLQIVIRSTKTNIDDYIAQVQAIAERQSNALLKQQTLHYAAFIHRLVELSDIMQKRFLVVVPIDSSDRQKTIVEQFIDWMRPDDSSVKISLRNRIFHSVSKRLTERVDLVTTSLTSIGLHVRRLDTRDLIELFYQVYNPKTSKTQKLPPNEEDLHLEKNVL